MMEVRKVFLRKSSPPPKWDCGLFPLFPPSLLRVSLQKDCFNRVLHPSVCNPEATKELTAGPPPSDPSLFPLHAKDTAKATAIVCMLFILSQDCVVIYTVNNENTL